MSSGRAGSQFNDDVKSTYGFAPTGDILAKGYASDVGREVRRRPASLGEMAAAPSCLVAQAHSTRPPLCATDEGVRQEREAPQLAAGRHRL